MAFVIRVAVKLIFRVDALVLRALVCDALVDTSGFIRSPSEKAEIMRKRTHNLFVKNMASSHLSPGIPVRTTLDNSTTVQYAGLLHQVGTEGVGSDCT